VARRDHRIPLPSITGVWVTQVIRWSGPPAVVRVEMPGDVIVALPCQLHLDEALDLARLVLDGREYAELARKIKQPQARGSHSAS
jgi:hypothetical protein